MIEQIQTQIQAMSDPTRFAILQLVKEQELPAGKIAKDFPDITRPAVSQHLRVLKNSGLLNERREGTKRLYCVRQEGFQQIKEFLEEFWQPRLQKLKAAAEHHERNKK
jgi:DNA-binding transcriptional ArsR family regulator